MKRPEKPVKIKYDEILNSHLISYTEEQDKYIDYLQEHLERATGEKLDAVKTLNRLKKQLELAEKKQQLAYYLSKFGFISTDAREYQLLHYPNEPLFTIYVNIDSLTDKHTVIVKAKEFMRDYYYTFSLSMYYFSEKNIDAFVELVDDKIKTEQRIKQKHDPFNSIREKIHRR